MKGHLSRDLAKLSDQIADLGSLVAGACDKAVAMLEGLDMVLADEILGAEGQINEMEVEVEEECLKVLALHQPVSEDLRFLILVLKVNNDLERMGDQVVNVAERVRFLADKERVVADLSLVRMGQIASKMVHSALRALVRRDVDAAREVAAMDDELDVLHRQTYKTLQEVMMKRPAVVPPAVSYLTISNNLERIGDLATNIAEEIVFMEEGEVVRHQANP